LKYNNNFRLKRTVIGVSCGLLLLCNSTFSQDQNLDNTFTLNLKNTDIHSLISTVSKQTGRNFVVDPRVKAKVTVISTDPVSADGLYKVFLSVLQVHGYSAVPAGDLIKIVPDVTAKQGPVPILGEDTDSSDQLVTQVVPVVNVPAAQLVPILRPMVPQQGHLAAYAATNSLIITDRSSNIQRLMEIIRRVDKPDNEEIEVVRLNHAAASEIVRTLTSLQRNNLGGPQGPGATQLVADERTNSVLISGDTAVRIRMRGLIAHLDTPIQSGGNTRVVYLKFANAEDMVSILQGVSQGQAKVGAGAPDDGAGVPRPAAQQQQPANNGNTPAVPNQAATQQNNAVRARSAADVGESNVDIQADPNTNALIITAPPDEMQNILAVIRQLDIRRAQVLVEAVIAEITEDNTREFGINFLLDGRDNSNAPIGFSNLGGGTESIAGIAAAVDGGGVPPSLGAGISLALGRFGSGAIDFGFLVRAIASDADNNILSTPSLLTLDNEEAEIIVGSNVPFVTGQQLSANNDNPFQTIERRDVGLTLKVKPQINDGNTIKMELEQEVSDVSATAVTGASDITTSVRSIKTTVLVEDGQTLVLGGLIDDSINDVVEKVPLLGDIPVIGNLFRFRSTQKSKQNLMIFLHPVIMRDADTAAQFSSSKYNFLRSQQTSHRQEKEDGTGREEEALPELKLFFKGKPIDSPLTSFDKPPAPTSTLGAAQSDLDTLASIGLSDANDLLPNRDVNVIDLRDKSSVSIDPSVTSNEYQTDVEAFTQDTIPTLPKPAAGSENRSEVASTELATTFTDTLTGTSTTEIQPTEAVSQTDNVARREEDVTPARVDQTVGNFAVTNAKTTQSTKKVILAEEETRQIENSIPPASTESSSAENIATLIGSANITDASTAADASPPAISEATQTRTELEGEDLIAMANIWQLDTLPSAKESTVISAQVEILSISVTNIGDQITGEIIAGDIGSSKIAPPTVSVSSAFASPKLKADSAKKAAVQIVDSLNSVDPADVNSNGTADVKLD